MTVSPPQGYKTGLFGFNESDEDCEEDQVRTGLVLLKLYEFESKCLITTC